MRPYSIPLFLIALSAAAPSGDEKSLDSPDSCVLYKGQYDIINIVVPLNAINYYRDASSGLQGHSESTFFFIEADVDTEGKRIYKGLYMFKKNKATILLENGRGAAAASDGTTQVFLAADDGLYVYKTETNEVVKYGSITDNIIGIAKPHGNDVIYILTEEHELYKVTDAGNTKTKVDEVVNAQEIVLDYHNNIYFYAQDKQPYVLTTDGVKKIAGLPDNLNKVSLLKPPYTTQNGVPCVINNAVYIIYEDGTSELIDPEFQRDAKVTAYAMEGTLVQYFAYNRKIYEFNFLPRFFTDMEKFVNNKASAIRVLSTEIKRGIYRN
ncbi:uncharacterized protein [Epargyreus clarus]|uniref:uncharacterized protein n=1 Tax=Epargyreus clarus TaxID=520877 RepID=UPI003C2DC170